MKKVDVIRKLCSLSTNVGNEVFGNLNPHDCFCDMSKMRNPCDFQFSEEIIAFIETAILEKIQSTNKEK